MTTKRQFKILVCFYVSFSCYVYMCTTQTKTYESTLDCTHNSKHVHVSTVAHAHKPETHPYTNAKHIHAHNPNGTFVIPILTIEAERKKKFTQDSELLAWLRHALSWFFCSVQYAVRFSLVRFVSSCKP